MDGNKEVILVEDNDEDAELITMAIGELELPLSIKRARDGVEAMQLLRLKRASIGNTAVVLLDIKLPRMNGIEVLLQMKADDVMKNIPVVMLTSSREKSDVLRCYHCGANAYVVKPVDFREFLEALRCTGRFWCAVNEMPV
jgi:CheY-like chemotaxis protein